MRIARILESICVSDDNLAGIRPRAHSRCPLDRNTTGESSRNAKDMSKGSNVQQKNEEERCEWGLAFPLYLTFL